MADPIEGTLVLDISSALAAVARLETRLDKALNAKLNLSTAGASGAVGGRSGGLGNVATQAKAATSALQGANRQALQFQRNLAQIGKTKLGNTGLTSTLPAGMTSLVTASNKAATATGSVLRRLEAMQDAGAGIRRVGDVISATITVPATLAARALVNVTTQYDAFIQQSVNLANLAAEDIAQVNDALLDMSKAVGRGPRELAEAFYFIESSGVIDSTAEALALTEEAGKGAAIGLGTATDVAKLLTTELAAFGPELGTPQRALDALIETIRQGKAEPAELVNNIGRAIPLIKQAGLEATEGAGALAYLSRETNSAGQATTFLINFLNKIVAPSRGAREEAAQLGFTFEELQKVFTDQGFAAGIDFLRQRVDVQSASFKKLFPEIRAASGATLLLTADQQNLGDTIDAVSNRTGQAADSIDRLQGSQSFQLQRAKAELEVAAVRVGTLVVPSIVNLVERLSDLFDAYSRLPAPVIALSTALVGYLALAGPVLSAYGRLKQALGLIGGAFIKAGAQAETGAATTVAAAASIRAALTGLGVTAVLAVLAVGVYEVVKAFKGWGSEAEAVEQDVRDLVGTTAQHVDILGDEAAATQTATDLMGAYGDAIRETIAAKAADKLGSRNQIDDLQALGYEVEDLVDLLYNTPDAQTGIEQIFARAVRSGQIEIKRLEEVVTTAGSVTREVVLPVNEAIAAIRNMGAEALLTGTAMRGPFATGNEELIQTLIELAKASDEYIQVLKDSAAAGDLGAAAALKQSAAFGTLTAGEKKNVNTLLEVAAAMSDAELAAQGYGYAIDGIRATAEGAEGPIEGTGEAIGGVGEEAGGAAEAVVELKQALDDLVENATNTARLALDIRDGFAEISAGWAEASEGFTKMPDLTDRRIIDPLLNQIDRLAQQASLQLSQGLDEETIQANWSRDLREALSRAGVDTEEEIKAFSEMFDIPLNIGVETTVDGEEVVQFLTAVDAAAPTVEVTPVIHDEEERLVERRLDELAHERTAIVQAEARGVDEILGKLALIPRSITMTVRAVDGASTTLRNIAEGRTTPAKGRAYGDITQPHVARDGDNLYKYAEPGTGGEAWIPLANDGRRGRAVGITKQVAKKFGYDMVPMADGGLLSDEMNQALGRSFEAALEPAVGGAAKAIQKTPAVEMTRQAFTRLIYGTIVNFLNAASIDFGEVKFTDEDGKSTIAASLTEAMTGAVSSSVDTALAPAIEAAATRLQKTTAVELAAQKLQALMDSMLRQFFESADTIGPLKFYDDENETNLISQALSEALIGSVSTAVEKTLEPAIEAASKRLTATQLVPEFELRLRRLIVQSLSFFFESAESIGPLKFYDDESKTNLISQALSEGVIGALSTTIEKTLEPAIKAASEGTLASGQVSELAGRLQALAVNAIQQFLAGSFDVGVINLRDEEGRSIINESLKSAVVSSVTTVLDTALEPAVKAASERVSAGSLVPAVQQVFENLANQVLTKVASISPADLDRLIGESSLNDATSTSASTGTVESQYSQQALLKALANLESAYRSGGGSTTVTVNSQTEPLDEQRLAQMIERERRMRSYARVPAYA